MRRSAALSCLIVVLLAPVVIAGPVTQEIPFARRTTLTVPRTYTFRFSLWDSADTGAGTMVWSEETTVDLTTKTVRHDLGSVNSLGGVDFSQQLWVQVDRWKKKAGDWVPVGGRTMLKLAPYALWSASAGIADGAAIGEILDDDGAGSLLDADLLDGQHASAFAASSHQHAAGDIVSGTLGTDRYSAIADLAAEGYLGDASGDLAQNNTFLQRHLNADRLDGREAASFADLDHDHDDRYYQKSFVDSLVARLTAVEGKVRWLESAASTSNGELVEASSWNALAPRIAVNAAGVAFAVWEQGDDMSLYASRYEPGTGWGAAQLLEESAEWASDHDVAVDSAGNAIAVWQQYDGATRSTYARRYAAGVGWDAAPQLIEASAEPCWDSVIAGDDAGNAVVVWRQDDGVRNSIWANRYQAGSGWTGALLLEETIFDAEMPHVAMNGAGVAVAVWVQFSGFQDRVYANRYVPGTGWSGRAVIDSSVGAAVEPRVAVDSAGNAVAVWIQDDGSYDSVYSNRCDAAGVWGTAGLIESDSEDAREPGVAVDASGNAVAVWCQYDPDTRSVRANVRDVTSGWGTVRGLETGAGIAEYPWVVYGGGGGGGAVALWRQVDGAANSLFSTLREEGGDWGTVVSLESASGGVGYAEAASSGDVVMVVWNQYDGSVSHIYAKRLH